MKKISYGKISNVNNFNGKKRKEEESQVDRDGIDGMRMYFLQMSSKQT